MITINKQQEDLQPRPTYALHFILGNVQKFSSLKNKNRHSFTMVQYKGKQKGRQHMQQPLTKMNEVLGKYGPNLKKETNFYIAGLPFHYICGAGHLSSLCPASKSEKNTS